MAPCRAARSAHTASSAHSTFGPVDAGDVGVEALQQGLERAVVLEEVELDVEQDRAGQRQLEVRAVALVGLDDEQLAARPVGAGAGVGDVAADDEARRAARRRRGSASASTWSSSCRACRRRRWPGPGRRSRPASRPGAASGCPARGRGELDVVGRDRRRRRDGVAAVDDGGVVADVHVDAGGADPVEHRLVTDVAARHGVAHLGEGDGDGGHARTTDADDVQPQRSGEVERRTGRFEGRESRHGARQARQRDHRLTGHRLSRRSRARHGPASATASSTTSARVPPRCSSPAPGRGAGHRRHAAGSARSPSITVAEPGDLGLGQQHGAALVGQPAHVQRSGGPRRRRTTGRAPTASRSRRPRRRCWRRRARRAGRRPRTAARRAPRSRRPGGARRRCRRATAATGRGSGRRRPGARPGPSSPAWSPTNAATAALSAAEPCEPPVTATTKRSAGSPSAARAGVAVADPVDGQDVTAQRGAGDDGPRQRRVRVGDGRRRRRCGRRACWPARAGGRS